MRAPAAGRAAGVLSDAGACCALPGLREHELLAGLAGGVAIGVAFSLLLAARVPYRFGTLRFLTGERDPHAMHAFGRSALTLLAFGVVAGHFVTCAIGVPCWRARTAGTPTPDAA